MNKTMMYGLVIGAVAVSALVGYSLLGDGNSAVANTTVRAAPASPVQLNNRVLRYPQGAPQLAYLRIEQAAVDPVPVSEPFNGRIAYNEDVTARISTPIDGRIIRLQGEVGDVIARGAPLLWLNAPEYAQAMADVRSAEVALKQRQLSYARAKTLFDGGVLARKDFELADSELQQMRVEHERAKSRLANLDANGIGRDGEFPLRAPLRGTITERHANPGSQTRTDAADPLYVVSDLSRLWVIAELAERDLSKVKMGATVTVAVDAYPGEVFTGRIVQIGDVVDPATRRVAVRALISNDHRRLKPEMFVRITPVEQGRALPNVPNAALVTQGVNTFVFVEISPGALEKRNVTLAFRGNERSYIQSGVQPGEHVVTSGAILLNAELGG